METVEIKAVNQLWGTILVLAVLAAGFGLYAVLRGWQLGWVAMAVFGVGSVFAAKRAFDPTPRLVLDNEGVLDRSLWVGLIPWHDIVGAYVVRMGRHSFVCLELRDEDKYVSRLSPFVRALTRLNEKFGFTRLSINLSNTDADPYMVLAIVLKMSGAKMPTSPRQPKRRRGR
jgi:hypothetical protein